MEWLFLKLDTFLSFNVFLNDWHYQGEGEGNIKKSEESVVHVKCGVLHTVYSILSTAHQYCYVNQPPKLRKFTGPETKLTYHEE